MNQLWRPPQHPPGCDCGCCGEWSQCDCPPESSCAGEFVSAHLNVPVAQDGDWPLTLTMLTLAPGDWDIQAEIDCPFVCTGVQFGLFPQPPGMSGSLGLNIQLTSGTFNHFSGPCLRERGLFTAPTTLTFEIGVTGIPAGTALSGADLEFGVNARRLR